MPARPVLARDLRCAVSFHPFAQRAGDRGGHWHRGFHTPSFDCRRAGRRRVVRAAGHLAGADPRNDAHPILPGSISRHGEQCLRIPALDRAFVMIDEPQIIDPQVWNVFLRAGGPHAAERMPSAPHDGHTPATPMGARRGTGAAGRVATHFRPVCDSGNRRAVGRRAHRSRVSRPLCGERQRRVDPEHRRRRGRGL